MARFTIHMVTPGTRRGNKLASKIWIIRLTSSTPRDTLTLGLILLIAAESTGTDEEKKHFSILVQCLSQIGYIHIMHSGIHSCNCDHRSHCICNCRHHHCHRHYLRHHHNQDGQMVAASGSSPHQWSILWLCRNSVPTFALSWKLCQITWNQKLKGGYPLSTRWMSEAIQLKKGRTCIEWVFREVPVPGELISW